MKLPYDSVCPSVGRSVGRSVVTISNLPSRAPLGELVQLERLYMRITEMKLIIAKELKLKRLTLGGEGTILLNCLHLSGL